MLGYLAAGILIGPHALALAQNSEGVRHLGEFGVVFLMFAIGLEFNLPKLRACAAVFGLGLQVLLTMLVTAWLAAAGTLGRCGTWAGRAPGPGRRAGHEQHRHRGQADGRAWSWKASTAGA
jgi:CPA2 family monovalent cation:H+ antiporter-2